MLRCLCLSSISLLVSACPGPDPVCGAGDADDDGVTATAAGDVVTYGDWRASANNDCPAPEGSAISVTVFAEQVSPAGNAVIGFCLPRPDLVESGRDVELVPVHEPALASDRVQVVDVEGVNAAGCRWAMSGDPSGTARFEGFCDDGGHADGFALTLDATVPVTESGVGCDGAYEITLAGTVAVAPQ